MKDLPRVKLSQLWTAVIVFRILPWEPFCYCTVVTMETVLLPTLCWHQLHYYLTNPWRPALNLVSVWVLHFLTQLETDYLLCAACLSALYIWEPSFQSHLGCNNTYKQKSRVYLHSPVTEAWNSTIRDSFYWVQGLFPVKMETAQRELNTVISHL